MLNFVPTFEGTDSEHNIKIYKWFEMPVELQDSWFECCRLCAIQFF